MKSVKYVKEIKNCMDCPNHKVQRDPDPHDSFCSDDEMVVCMAAKCKIITQACRPYMKRAECMVPSWCPLKKPK